MRARLQLIRMTSPSRISGVSQQGQQTASRAHGVCAQCMAHVWWIQLTLLHRLDLCSLSDQGELHLFLGD